MHQLRTLLRRALVRAVDDSTRVQAVQASHGATLSGDRASDGVENLAYPPGVRGVPRVGATAVFAALGGQTANGVIVAMSDPADPPPLGSATGEVGFYLDGNYTVFSRADGVVVLAGDATEGRAATDAVPVDSAVQEELTRLQSELIAAKADLTALKAAWAAATAAAAAAPAPDKGAAGFSAGQSAVAAVPTLSPAAPGTTASARVIIPSDT